MSGLWLTGLEAGRQQAGKRLAAEALYALSAYLFLRRFFGGDPFCHGARTWSAVTSLAFGISLLDLAMSLLAGFGYGDAELQEEHWLLGLLCAVVMCGALVFLPGLLFKGYGVFRLEGTVFDVSCLFREGYGIGFSIVVAPTVAGLTLLREILIGRWLQKERRCG